MGGALLVVRYQLKQRQKDQEAQGIRSSRKMTWEEKVLDEERKVKDREQRAKEKLSGMDSLAGAERKMKDALSSAELKTRADVGKER